MIKMSDKKRRSKIENCNTIDKNFRLSKKKYQYENNNFDQQENEPSMVYYSQYWNFFLIQKIL